MEDVTEVDVDDCVLSAPEDIKVAPGRGDASEGAVDVVYERDLWNQSIQSADDARCAHNLVLCSRPCVLR